MKPLATISCDQDLHRALRARADQIKVTFDAIDAACDFPDRYTAKLLSPKRSRQFSVLTAWAITKVLGCKFLLVIDPDLERKYTTKLVRRRFNAPLLTLPWGRAKHLIVSKRFVRTNGRKGGVARAKSLRPSRRRAIARLAARARWGMRTAKPTPGFTGQPKARQP